MEVQETARIKKTKIKMSDLDCIKKDLPKKISKSLIDIGWQRTCNCPKNHINCMTPKEWLKSQLGVWLFN